jgi:hypothetical protein
MDIRSAKKYESPQAHNSTSTVLRRLNVETHRADTADTCTLDTAPTVIDNMMVEELGLYKLQLETTRKL